MVMELKYKQGFVSLLENEKDVTKEDDIEEDSDCWTYDEDEYELVTPVTYRSIGIQTESPFMVDKAIQVCIPKTRKRNVNGKNSNNSVSTPRPIKRASGLMPNILYNGNAVNYMESPGIRDVDNNTDLSDETEENRSYQPLSVKYIPKPGSNKRKSKTSSGDGATSNKCNKQKLDDESLSHQDNDSDDLRLGLISDDFEDMDSSLVMAGSRSGEASDEGLEVDDLYIFTHHPTGLSYQIFNEKRSINKEMMEKVFSSVIGKEDKYYLCLYPPHSGTCHSNAGKSTKIRVVKNHLTSHLFLYRCRLCGRTYKYYNNLFNHFNKHPR